MKLFQQKKAITLALASLFVSASALADINIGFVVSATGPAASLGIPEKLSLIHI